MASRALRRGLVLGGGGMLGAAWTTGALNVLTQAVSWDPREAEMLVGTSAGAVLAALIGAGASPADLYEHQLTGRISRGPLAGLEFDYATAAGGVHPERPRLRLGSGHLLARTARHPRSVPPTAVMAAALPPGRGSLGGVGELVRSLPDDGAGWSPHKALRVVALDFATGRRVTFGGARAPRTTLAEAVTASCAIPGWFAPVVIEGRRYVDGGMWSATNVDVAAKRGFQEIGEPPLDELYVLAPMAVHGFDGPPRSVLERAIRRYRRAVTRRMLAEVQRVRADGTRVVVFCPTAEDIHAIGFNMMDAGRRPHVLDTAIRTTGAQVAAQRAAA
ncbi:patatin-like phospholipase family protein [Catenulispora yoronensis]|uniref:Patatin-like phospholipase family protein n=1 Tax=Catenulispora yoronensis TaxID=450799 RepID=A0ABP5H5R5_9ACTN